jgi:hypothetical protein
MIENIGKILEDGVKAPSGENCQPWKFEVTENRLLIYNLPEADMSLYNSRQKGSYVAHGALIENIEISAKEFGYTISVDTLPDKENINHVATITFIKSEHMHDSLYACINTRCTNRKDYTGEKIPSEQKKILQESIADFAHTAFIIIDDESKMQSLGQALAVNERILFENKYLHDFFYEHIIWDKKDEAKAGFYIETLEFLPHQLGAVKLFKNWTILSLFNKILGVSKKISKENGEKYTRSGAFGAITVRGDTIKDYITMGRAVQRIWLTATKHNIAMHPCNGVIYFMEQIQDNGGKEFSVAHQKIVKDTHATIVQEFGSTDSRLGFIFRMGKSNPPTAQAKRLKPVIVYS